MYSINPKFSLKKPNKDGRSLISLRVAHNNTEFIYSTGEKISPQYWDTKRKIEHGKSQTDRVIIPRNEGKKLIYQENKGILLQLRRYEEAIYMIFENCRMQKIIPNNEYLKDEMDKLFKIKKPETDIDFLSFIEKTIQETKDGRRLTRNGKKMDVTTIKGYVTTLNHLKEFREEKRIRVDYDISMYFYKAFVSYFREEGKSINTIGKNIKNLKVFLKEAYNQGLTNNRIFEDPDFRIIEEDTEQIYLNEEEIKQIYEVDLQDNSKLDRVRDLFIIGCYTGLRYADLGQLSSANISSNGDQIKIKTKKTGEVVVIPVHPMVKHVFDKYDGDLPRVISNQKFNEYIKVVARKAGLTDPVPVSKTRGGMRVDDTKDKCDLITSHTCRRSFASNAYMADIPTISIMKITGHKTERAFLKYIRITPEENAEKLKMHAFFSPKLEVVK